MLNKILNVTKNTIFGNESISDSFLNSKLFSRYSINSRRAPTSYTKLMSYLTDGITLYGSSEILDASVVRGRVQRSGRGLFAAIIMDIPVFVKNEVSLNGTNESHSTATIHVPIHLNKEWLESVDEIFHQNLVPAKYTFPTANNDIWEFRHDPVGYTFTRNFDHKYHTDAPAVCPNIYKSIDAVFDKFVNHPEEYVNSNVPRNENIMLYGPPGTGKTSLMAHFAEKYNCNVVDTNPNIDPKHLKQLLREIDNIPTVVMIEEIESNRFLTRSFNTNVATDTAEAPKLIDNTILRNMLNLLAGIDPLENCIFIITSNNPELLMPAIYRMGRMHHIFEITYPEQPVIDKFLGFRSSHSIQKYLNTLEDKRLPLAAIYAIKKAKTVAEVKDIIAKRDLSLSLHEYNKSAPE